MVWGARRLISKFFEEPAFHPSDVGLQTVHFFPLSFHLFLPSPVKMPHLPHPKPLK